MAADVLLTPEQILQMSYENAAKYGFAGRNHPTNPSFEQNTLYTDLLACLQVNDEDRYNYLLQRATDQWGSGQEAITNSF